VNQIQSSIQTDEQISAEATNIQDLTISAPRIERCEFESLLERAMEVLSARATSAFVSHA